jgi:hypothetical protein
VSIQAASQNRNNQPATAKESIAVLVIALRSIPAGSLDTFASAATCHHVQRVRTMLYMAKNTVDQHPVIS